jgi:hypothetical protein
VAKALVALLTRMAGTALAADPCADDAKRLCPDVGAGSGRLVNCLKETQPRLSAGCQQKLDEGALKARRWIEGSGRACREDVTQLCGSVEPGEFRIEKGMAGRFIDWWRKALMPMHGVGVPDIPATGWIRYFPGTERCINHASKGSAE